MNAENDNVCRAEELASKLSVQLVINTPISISISVLISWYTEACGGNCSISLLKPESYVWLSKVGVHFYGEIFSIDRLSV